MKQIGLGELHEIKVLLEEGYNIPQVALKIGRDKTTIYRLFQNNGILYNQVKLRYIGGYTGKTGKKIEDNLIKIGKKKILFSPLALHSKRVKKKSTASRRYCRIQEGSEVEKFVLKYTKEYYSPKQISGRWRLMTDERLSKDTIYSYIYNTHPELIKQYFRRKGKRYQNKRKQKYQLDQRRMIDRRPKSIEKRTTLGHWEPDTVVGKRKSRTKKVILTHVERKSGFLIARVLPNSQAQSVVDSTLEDFQKLPKYKRKTMTFDNGREFAYHYMIEKQANINIYFAHPYCSRERGTNENTNGLIRQFLPKGTDFETLTEKELQKYVTLINHRPRERLNFKTLYEVFYNKSKSCVGL